MIRSCLNVFFVLLSISFVSTAQPGIISTIAGSGIAGFGGDGGPATAAMTNHPIGIAIDGAGNIFIAEHDNNRVRKISTTGIISTVAGTGVAGFSGDGGPATSAKLYRPYWVCVDPVGNLYIADAFNNRIRKINTSGIISTIAGTGTAGYGGDGGPATAARLSTPTCVKRDNAGNLYFTDNGNKRVRKITASGTISTIAGTGVIGYTGDGGLATGASLNYPSSVCIDASGNVLIADSENNAIRKVNTSGIISTIAGTGVWGFSGDGGPATLAKVNRPNDIIVDSVGNIYFADNLNNRVRKVDLSGVIVTIAGTGFAGFSGDGGPATAAQLNGVNGLFFDATGSLLITDVLNQRIRKIAGTITNNPPNFTKGSTADLDICGIETSLTYPIDTFLSVLDLDVAQTLSLSIVVAPTHGSVAGSYATTSTGGTITPSGFTYSHTLGYIGADMFRVMVTDGIASDTITMNITISNFPLAGLISGTDSVCPSDTVTLYETVSGGNWISDNTAIASVNSLGIVTGITSGSTSIKYTVTNACGTVSATYPFKVRNAADCPVSISNHSDAMLSYIYPNPNNGNCTVRFYSAGEEQAEVNVLNMIGQKVKSYKIVTNKPFDMSLDIPSGVYIIEATSALEKWTKPIFINRN